MKRRQVLFRGVATPIDRIAIGASRIGGPPDLPEGIDWPRVPDGRCMPMVLQLALADIARFPAAKQLPISGTLYFFGAQNVTDWRLAETDNMPAAILHVSAGKLSRAELPDEASDEDYWDGFDICRIDGWRANDAHDEDEDGETDEPGDSELHVLLPAKKYSVAFGLSPPDGYTPVLEMRSDYGIRMNWGDAAWATWMVPDDDLKAARFDRATALGWIG